MGVVTLHLQPSGWSEGRDEVSVVWAEPLLVDPVAHAEKVGVGSRRMWVRGPGAEDCAIWVGASTRIGTAGSGCVGTDAG